MSACTECGKVAELRPYGKDFAPICYECSMQDEARTRRTFVKRLNEASYGVAVIGVNVVSIGTEAGPQPLETADLSTLLGMDFADIEMRAIAEGTYGVSKMTGRCKGVNVGSK